MDMFGRPMPGFNVKGAKQVNSLLGSARTLLILFCVMMYASTNFVQLYSRHNPNISTHNEVKFFSSEEPLNLNQVNFRFAIAFEDYRTEESKFDPRYIRWLFRRYWSRDGVIFEQIL